MNLEHELAQAVVRLHEARLLRPTQDVLSKAADAVGIEYALVEAVRSRQADQDSLFSRSLAGGQRPASSSPTAPAAPSSTGEVTPTMRRMAVGKTLSEQPKTVHISHSLARSIRKRGPKPENTLRRSLETRRCEGPCGQIKPESCFYKAEDPWCMSDVRRFSAEAQKRYRKAICPTCGTQLDCSACKAAS